MSEWEEMVEFAEWLAAYGKQYSGNSNFEEQRMAVVLLDQSMELMMKAFLIKNGYKIDYYLVKDINHGLKENDSVGKEMLIGFYSALELVIKEIPDINEREIDHFHKIRNKIYHGAIVNLKEDKVSEMEKFIPELKKFYELAFKNRSFKVNVIDRTIELRNRLYE